MRAQGPPQEPDAARQGDAGLQRPEQEINRATRWLTTGGEGIQIVVGVLLLLGALLAVGYAVFHFIDQLATATLTLAFPSETIHLSVEQNLAAAIINLISDLLLVLIIGEVFNTILHYLRDRTIYLKPFLFIGIISAVRDILVTSARLAILEVQEKPFEELMIELGVNLAIVIGLSLSLRLIRREDASDPL
ncbi:MAG TPA: phosphate-starvation-inducible PsiE family protein [Ktedonobacterales bacterium]|nr:phosphate-starvation-inducible PsiE family protein [Ktedonobacterales bacterium]